MTHAEAQTFWDGASVQERQKRIRCAQWVSPKGGLTTTGRRILKMSWSEMSPSVRNIFIQMCEQDENKECEEKTE